MPLNKKQKKDYAYFQLVTAENDFLGMIAYTKYKKSKIEYIEKYFAENGGYPDDEQLKEYQKQQCLDTNISNYRKAAEYFLNAYLTLYVEDKDKELKDKSDELNKKENELNKKAAELNRKNEKMNKKISGFETKKRNSKKEHGFIYGVAQSLVASFIILVISVFILLSSKFQESLAQKITDKISTKVGIEEIKD